MLLFKRAAGLLRAQRALGACLSTSTTDEDPIRTYRTLQRLVMDPSPLCQLGTVDSAFPVDQDEDGEEDKENQQLRRSLRALSRDTPFAIGGAMRLCEHDERCVRLKTGQLASVLADVDYEKVASLCVPSAFGHVATGQTLMDTAVRTGLELDANPSQASLVVADPDRQTAEWLEHGYTFTFVFPHAEPEAMAERIKSELAGLAACYPCGPAAVRVNRPNPAALSRPTHQQPVFLGRILHHLQQSLLPDTALTLEPYKLMVYEAGGHFKAHRDAPVKDMVATLLVALPSQHTGGVLEVREQHGL